MVVKINYYVPEAGSVHYIVITACPVDSTGDTHEESDKSSSPVGTTSYDPVKASESLGFDNIEHITCGNSTGYTVPTDEETIKAPLEPLTDDIKEDATAPCYATSSYYGSPEHGSFARFKTTEVETTYTTDNTDVETTTTMIVSLCALEGETIGCTPVTDNCLPHKFKINY